MLTRNLEQSGRKGEAQNDGPFEINELSDGAKWKLGCGGMVEG
jgi:hypothetical protein